MTLVRAPEHVAAEILEELIDRVHNGDEVEITRDGEAIVRLSASSAQPKTRYAAGFPAASGDMPRGPDGA
ncbi:MAG: hypothetical protein KTR21_06525 [Rhodobacteraceae bacterium]|nr:hypothetical protein [Paracoccaceae bacterium]